MFRLMAGAQTLPGVIESEARVTGIAIMAAVGTF
jgi:hypothetical protein